MLTRRDQKGSHRAIMLGASVRLRDPVTGRLVRQTREPQPFGEYLDAPRTANDRDGRSDRPRAARNTTVSFRFPPIVIEALRLTAQSRNVTPTHVVLKALEPALLPALQELLSLRDKPRSDTLRSPTKLPRLVQQIPSDVTRPLNRSIT
jgi:hypothetical protein